MTEEKFTRFEKIGLGYRLWSETIGTELQATHLKRSSGNLECDLLVRTTMKEIKTIDGKLFQARFNMSSGQTRTSIANSLSKRAPGINIDWGIMLEELCQKTIDAESRGEPIELVGGAPITQRVSGQYALFPFVPRNVTALLYGPGGAGKSVMALTGLMSVALGHELIPGCAPGVNGPALYLDWETDRHVIAERISMIATGYDFKPVNIHYRRCRRPLASDAEDLAQFVEREGIVYVVIDSAGMAMGASREYGDANEGTLRLFEAIRFINVSTQVIDHVSKAEKSTNGERTRSPYGSEYKTNLARSTWELRNLTETADENLLIQLINTKVNDARKADPLYFEIDWTPEHIKIMPADERAIGEGPPETSIAGLVDYLRSVENPLRPSEISEATGIQQGTLGTYLRRLVERGVLAHEGVTYQVKEGQ